MPKNSNCNFFQFLDNGLRTNYLQINTVTYISTSLKGFKDLYCWEPYKRTLNRPKFSETVTVSALAGQPLNGRSFGRSVRRSNSKQGSTLPAIQNNLNRYDDWLCVWREGMWDDECSS
ncbi:hypothetical protein BpHYR1_005530 [Brachionus plicatilis]|uniref:Uncharacterized protein n=1 Tax=Brachionus plicatilis TaxID=10195 RepID=A0A3M7Q9U7_BRAPC|nr:hypothetical protein BpHYR1_005530 [Brachionus plicatilis]